MTVSFWSGLAVAAGVTYLIRMLPMTLFTRRIRSRFFESFLYYAPIAILSAMVFPACFYATDTAIGAAVGVVVSVLLSWFNVHLLIIIGGASLAVFLTEYLLTLF